MEVVYIETALFEKMMKHFKKFAEQIDSLCQKSTPKTLET